MRVHGECVCSVWDWQPVQGIFLSPMCVGEAPADTPNTIGYKEDNIMD